MKTATGWRESKSLNDGKGNVMATDDTQRSETPPALWLTFFTAALTGRATDLRMSSYKDERERAPSVVGVAAALADEALRLVNERWPGAVETELNAQCPPGGATR